MSRKYKNKIRELVKANNKYRKQLTKTLKNRYVCKFCVPPCGMGLKVARSSGDIKRHIASKCGTTQSESNRLGLPKLNQMYAKEFKKCVQLTDRSH